MLTVGTKADHVEITVDGQTSEKDDQSLLSFLDSRTTHRSTPVKQKQIIALCGSDVRFVAFFLHIRPIGIIVIQGAELRNEREHDCATGISVAQRVAGKVEVLGGVQEGEVFVRKRGLIQSQTGLGALLVLVHQLDFVGGRVEEDSPMGGEDVNGEGPGEVRLSAAGFIGGSLGFDDAFDLIGVTRVDFAGDVRLVEGWPALAGRK